jgi:hypothetical protein
MRPFVMLLQAKPNLTAKAQRSQRVLLIPLPLRRRQRNDSSRFATPETGRLQGEAVFELPPLTAVQKAPHSLRTLRLERSGR